MTASWLWELDNQAENRVPDPVDYIEMRRRTFGSDMTMSLSRLSHLDDVPQELYRTRAVRSMEDAAQDYACFVNDLFSYQKEIQFEGELHNLVLVVQHFLNVDRHQARDVVVDLTAARMRQFQHAVAHELPVLFEEYDLDEAARSALTTHAEELEDWMSGILEWHRKCERYVEAELQHHHDPASLRENSSPLPVRHRLSRPGGLELAGFESTGLGVAAARLVDRVESK